MTLSSTLFGGGGISDRPAFVSNRFYPPAAVASGVTFSATNTDYFVPFVPWEDVTFDEIGWYRGSGTASNVYVACLQADGTRLDDCAVDADTTTGFHAVSTTDVNLTSGELYYFAINNSADAMEMWTLPTSDSVYYDLISRYGVAVDNYTWNGVEEGFGFEISRSNAAFPSSTTVTGATMSAKIPVIGPVVK